MTYEQAAYENADKKKRYVKQYGTLKRYFVYKKIELEIIDKITAKNYGFKIQRIHQNNRHN